MAVWREAAMVEAAMVESLALMREANWAMSREVATRVAVVRAEGGQFPCIPSIFFVCLQHKRSCTF